MRDEIFKELKTGDYFAPEPAAKLKLGLRKPANFEELWDAEVILTESGYCHPVKKGKTRIHGHRYIRVYGAWGRTLTADTPELLEKYLILVRKQ